MKILQNNRQVATLERTNTGSQLKYFKHILETQNSYPGYLATTLPYSELPVVQLGDNLHPFFINLLPEGGRLQMIMNHHKIQADDFFGLLELTGQETIGDVQTLSASTKAYNEESDRISKLTFQELIDFSLATPFETGISGVQEKVSGSVISLHQKKNKNEFILKLNPKNYPNIVRNENFFLQVAQSCGLKVNKAKIITDKTGEEGLRVTRFDRIYDRNKSVIKLHQEDACQLLNTIPANKYNISYNKVVDSIRKWSSAPQIETLKLIELYAFSYLIGNGDLHAKNVSLLWNQSGIISLTPVYDMLSTLPYELDKNMALKLDGKDNNFKIKQFVDFGKRYDIPEKATISKLTNLTKKITPWLPRLTELPYDEKTVESMQKEISRRLEKLKAT